MSCIFNIFLISLILEDRKNISNTICICIWRMYMCKDFTTYSSINFRNRRYIWLAVTCEIKSRIELNYFYRDICFDRQHEMHSYIFTIFAAICFNFEITLDDLKIEILIMILRVVYLIQKAFDEVKHTHVQNTYQDTHTLTKSVL